MIKEFHVGQRINKEAHWMTKEVHSGRMTLRRFIG